VLFNMNNILLISAILFTIVQLQSVSGESGCPDSIPCYLYFPQQCVAPGLDGQCPYSEEGLEDVETEDIEIEDNEEVENLIQDYIDTIFKWNGVEDCPDCNKPSCTCLHDLTSLEKLYSYGTYKDINVTDKLPMCDKQSRMIDGKGKSWCYVHRHSDCCGDNQQSSKYPNVDYSYQACQKPKTQAQAPCRKPCRCSDSTAGGRCEAPYKGEYWCYVDPEACCEKKVRSVRHKNLYWSTEPCNGVEISDLEDRLTEDGFLTCQEDQDCPRETPLQGPSRCLKRRCVEEECLCSPRSCSDCDYCDYGECLCDDERICYPDNTGENTSRTSSVWDFCSNPCNTSTCYIAEQVLAAAGAVSPLRLSSVAGVGFSSLAGQLVSTNGCPLRTISCKCSGDRCCAPLWGGSNRGIYCPFT